MKRPRNWILISGLLTLGAGCVAEPPQAHAPTPGPPRMAAGALRPPRGLIVHAAGTVDADARGVTRGVILLAGGGRDHDGAMRALVEAGGCADAVVLRMDDTGGGYVDYLMKLGVRSVRELVFDAQGGNADVAEPRLAELRLLADQPWVGEVIDRAEILFIAGGNQTKYVDAWRQTGLAAAVNRLVARGGAIGGTSAGMQVLGGWVHTPRGGGDSVTSDGALADPYIGRGEHRGTASLEFSDSPFSLPLLRDFVLDTHWSRRRRLGRSVTFLARGLIDGVRPLGALSLMACDEGVAVLVEVAENRARVFGPSGASAFFFRPDAAPDRCADNHALEWREGVPFFKVAGTADGRGAFDLAAWTAGPAAAASRAVVTAGRVVVR